MDIEQALADCRSFAADVLDDEADTYPDNIGQDAVNLAESFQALDQWLTAKGFLPTDWRQ